MKLKLKVRKTMCDSCPFRRGSKYQFLASDLTDSALNEASRICHSTGKTGILGDTGKPELLCRGARNIQLQVYAGIGFIESPTDKAWDKKRKELNV